MPGYFLHWKDDQKVFDIFEVENLFLDIFVLSNTKSLDVLDESVWKFLEEIFVMPIHRLMLQCDWWFW